MTDKELRDHYAGLAMQGFIMKQGNLDEGDVQLSFKYAERMMGERNELRRLNSKIDTTSHVSSYASGTLKDSPPVLVGSAWQPMNTAPRDGAVILGGYSCVEGYVLVSWSRERRCWVSGHHAHITPIYWMPIPPLPKSR